MNLNVRIEGKILDKLKTAPKSVRSDIKAGVLTASTLLMEASIRNAPASTGNLRKGIRRELSGSGLSASIFPTADYAFRIHGDGERQRSEPFWIPSREAQPGGTLYRWAKKKGMNPWAVRAAIAKRGIKLNPWLFKTSQQNEGKVEEIFSRVLDKIAGSLAD